MINGFYLVHILSFYFSVATLSALVTVILLNGRRVAYLISLLVAIAGVILFSLLGLLIQVLFPEFPLQVGTYGLPIIGAGLFSFIYIRLKAGLKD